MSFIRKAFGGLRMVAQYPCRNYRIDLYFPDQRVAVECDEENAHGGNRAQADARRESTLHAELGCVFVRFRPQRAGFDMSVVINELNRALGLIATQ